MSAVLAVVALVCALAAALGERARRRRAIREWGRTAPVASARPRGPGGPAAGRVLAGAESGKGVRRRTPLGGGRAGRADRVRDDRRSSGVEASDLALLVADVAGRLRAGAPTGDAWRAAWERLVPALPFTGIDEDGTPRVLEGIVKPPRLREVRGPADLARWRRARSAKGRAVVRAALALGAACRLSAANGAPLAEILDAVADGLDEAESVEEARRVAAAGARTSTRILTALPLLGVAAAQILGAAPLERFLDGGLGTMLGLVGVGFLLAARLVSDRLVARASASPQGLDEAIACDLARAALDAGASIPGVLEALGEASSDRELAAAGRGLRLGVSWDAAWEANASPALSRALEPAWIDGTAPDELLARTAAQIRSRRLADARAAAESLGVELAVPVGALLLPAFLVLGLGPVVLHLVDGGFGGLL